MIQLPFHKWSLSFINQEYEKRYDEEQIALKLFNFRLLSICLSIICLACLIIFVAQEQPYVLIFLMAALTGLSFCFVILSSRLRKYIKYAFPLCFIISVGGGVFISLSAFKIPEFLYGFNTCALGIFLLQHTDNKVKLFLVFGTPIISLGMFSLYDSETLQFVAFAISGAIMIGILLYHYEYTQRACFSLRILNQKQLDIIHEYLNDPFLAISFNQRTRQFELEFMNRSLEEQLAIHDTESMKEFFRNTVITKETNVFKSTDTQFKKNTSQQMSEEYLYEICQNDQDEDNFLTIHHIQKNHYQQSRKILIKKINYGKPILLILMKCFQSSEEITQNQKEMQKMKNIITDQLQHIGLSHQQLLKQISKTHETKTHEIYSRALMIFNSLQNSILFLQKEKLLLLSQDIKIFPLNQLLVGLNQIFICQSGKQNKKFLTINTIQTDFRIKLNIKFLSQILINVFELLLLKSQKSTTIILTISQYENQQRIIGNQENILLKFVFTFSSIKKIGNPFCEECKDEQSEIQNIITSVTNQLLSYLGPYNNIQFNQEYQINQSSGTYLNEVYFYIYSNQLLEDLSYTKYIKKYNQF